MAAIEIQNKLTNYDIDATTRCGCSHKRLIHGNEMKYILFDIN